MKKIFIFLMILIASACSEKFLDEDPKGRMTPEAFLKNAADLDMAVTAMYNRIAGLYRDEDMYAPLMGADDVTTRSGSNKETFREFDTFRATSANSRMADAWAFSYGAIRAANSILLNYEKATDATVEQREHAAGQAHFIRALAYFYLVRTWNSIPLITDLDVQTDIGKSNPAEIYSLIVSDLQAAEEFLPDSWTGVLQNLGPTVGSAKALLASVYLTMAGYPINDETKYALAAEKAKEVIDNASVYGYTLLNQFADLWTREQFNREIVFGIFYNVDIATIGTDVPNGNQRAPLPSQPEEEGGWDDYFAEINFFNDFPEGPRKDATFQTEIKYLSGGQVITKDWTEGVQKHPYYKKMRDITGYNPEKPWIYINWRSSRTNMIIRYAEVLLTYAEAKAMSGQPDATAYAAVNRVRNRAGLPDLPAGLSQTAFRDAVVAERAWEFAGNEPNARWFDLVRLEMVEEVAAGRNAAELEITSPPDKDDYFAPIPQGEILINPNLAD